MPQYRHECVGQRRESPGTEGKPRGGEGLQLGPLEDKCPEPMLASVQFGPGSARDFSGFLGPPRPPVSDMRRNVSWVGPGHLFCLPLPMPWWVSQTLHSPLGSAHPLPAPPGYPQLAHAHSCPHLSPLLRCVRPNPAGHPGCTLSWHACTCVCRPSLGPSLFLLSSPATPVPCISRR